MNYHQATSMLPLKLISIFILFCGLLNVSTAQDARSYQHGINFLKRPDGQWLLTWSSSGNPPSGKDKNGNWTHDIYYSLIDPSKPIIQPKTLISNPEAQEPASSTITDDGYIMITMEDGWNTERNVAQRFGIYDSALKPVKPYPQLVQDGGHSGHVTAVNNRFVVFYSDEWITGGGVENLGSGDDVLAKIYTDKGELKHSVAVAVSKKTRDWWPLTAGSKKTAMLVWQRFVDDKTWSLLMMAVLDPETGRMLKKPIQIANKIKYYTYNVAFLSALDRFLITGTNNNGKGFALLFSQTGELISSLENLPPIMREAQIIQHQTGKTTSIAQAIDPAGIMILNATADQIIFQEKLRGTQKWSISGTDGLFADENHLFLVGLSENGLLQQFFAIKSKNQ